MKLETPQHGNPGRGSVFRFKRGGRGPFEYGHFNVDTRRWELGLGPWRRDVVTDPEKLWETIQGLHGEMHPDVAALVTQ